MSAKFYTLLTDIGAAKLASAAALGVPLKITQMAVGDGGGALPTPSAQQTKLVAEKRRADLNMLYIDPQNSSQIIAEQVIPETEGGWWIREVGLFDEAGALIAVGNCPESYKPQLAEGSGRTQTVRMVLITSSTANITLKIDPAVVLATRQYVDDTAIEVRFYTDEAMKTHLAADNPHAQYLQKKNNLSDVTDKAKARASLGLGSASLKSIGTSGDSVPLLNNENKWSSTQYFNNGFAGNLVAEDLTDKTIDLNTLTIRTSVAGHLAAYTCWSEGGGKDIKNKPDNIKGNFMLYVESLRKVSPTDYTCCQTLISGERHAVYRRFCDGKSIDTWSPWVRDVTQNENGTIIPASYDNFDNRYLLRAQDFPVGIPQPWPTDTAPNGWLKCNGAPFDKIQYPGLAVAYPSGKLPDLRGEFIRGWDDGRGVDSGRSLLAWQDDMIKKHSHTLGTYKSVDAGIKMPVTAGAELSNSGVGGAMYTGEAGSSETRPRNIAFNYIVRAA